MLNSAPLFHIGGIAAIIGAPMIGSKLVLMQKWDLNEALRLAREEHVTSLGGVPAVARQILEHPGVAELDLHPYTWTMGGAAVPPDLPAKAVDLFGDELQVMNGYGLTETTSAVVANLGVEFLAHPDSVGRAHLTTDLHIVGPDGEVLGVDQVGEICVRSPQVALGYWRDVIATGASFVDGWFHTGDVGYIDGEGFLYVVDRMKDVVIRGGENVYSAEVEAVLHDHPGIAQAAIVAIEEGTLGERVCAVVVARERDELTLAEVRRFVAPRLAAFKCPEALLVVAELPMTATGKVAKNVLREQVAKATAELERGW